MEDIFYRQMPHSLEAEQSVIGSMLIDANCVKDVMEQLRPDDFYLKQNREIFETIYSMFVYSKPIDGVTVAGEMERAGLSTDDTRSYLVQLMEVTPTSANVMEYVRIVREKALLRAVAAAASDITAMVQEGAGEASKVLEAAEQKFYAIRRGRSAQNMVPISVVLQSVLERLGELTAAGGETMPGLTTGFSDVDRKINGLNKSDLLLLAARPGMGKTSMALNVAVNAVVGTANATTLLSAIILVPVTVALGGAYDTLVITGPNTGGKTVTLKTLGLLCLMAQCGLHIPAGDQSAVQVFDRVLADVGDEQSIEQSLSTFSAHMANTVEILKLADEKSLILFDELGAGTDPVEGAALAIAIIQDVRRKGALTAATTHYAELKTFAMTTAGVENASCEFDVQTLRPTYRLLIGIPGKSNAFAISRRLGLDESVIEDAKAQMDSESVRFEDVLTQLEEKRQRLEKAQGEADRLWRQREEDARKARTFREQMEKAKDNARTKGEAEARRIVQQAQRQADQVFAELDELRKQQQRSDYQAVNDRKSDIRRRLNEAETALHQRDEDTEPVPAPTRPIAVGDTVELAGVRTGAAVLAVNGDGTLLLQAGKMKMTVKAAQVRLLETAEEIEKKKKQSAAAQQRSGPAVSINTGARASAELDIRGLETLEAESVVENYLDAASRSKLGTVTIIHGKGTGALRAAVHQLLKKNKQVKSFRLGRYGEGEAGVTVVELK